MFNKAVWVFLLALIASGHLVSQELYRYIDENGVTILNSSIPAAYVNSGYEVINSQGQVIQVVLPTKAVEAEAPALVVERSDTILMSSYSDIIEIEEHRDRKIESILREIDNIKTDQRVLGLQMDKEIAERDRLAARIQRDVEQNKNTPQQILDQHGEMTANIEKMADTADKLEEQLQRRSKDRDAISTEYAVKVERFLQLEQSELDVRHTSTSVDGAN